MLEQVTDARKIYHRDIHGEAWSSIQLTTASSACAVVDLFFDQRLPLQGFVRQEDVSLQHFLANEFGKVYAVAEPISGV
jgi:saccharopine dehydrogenase-like NADP-dependent oxidoreductase